MTPAEIARELRVILAGSYDFYDQVTGAKLKRWVVEARTHASISELVDRIELAEAEAGLVAYLARNRANGGDCAGMGKDTGYATNHGGMAQSGARMDKCQACGGSGGISYNPNLNPNAFPGYATGKCTRCGGTGIEEGGAAWAGE